MSEWMEKLKKTELISLMKNKFYLLFILGILLIGISYVDIGETEKEKKEPKTEEVPEDYTTRLERKLRKMLQGMEGISDVKVMVTLKNSTEKIVKEDVESEKNQSEEGTKSEQEIHYKKTTAVFSADGEQPYVVKEIYPKVEGVAISAKGIGTIKRKNEIIQMMVALFDLPVHKISIMES
ncbi:MAG: hypothetical protein K6G85_09310 [Eubacterium sp.]|nr:hypothetical protein [Eubacterium sp.]